VFQVGGVAERDNFFIGEIALEQAAEGLLEATTVGRTRRPEAATLDEL
jgi:hypothetical protein